MSSLARTFRTAATVLALACIFAPATGRAEAGAKTLRFIPQADLRSIDPIWTTAYVTRNFGYLVFDTLLAINDSMSNLRGRWYEFRPAGVRSNDPDWSSAKLAVTYHPAFLLRDPRQKKEAWKDLQMVMKELGLKAPAKTVE